MDDLTAIFYYSYNGPNIGMSTISTNIISRTGSYVAKASIYAHRPYHDIRVYQLKPGHQSDSY